MDISLSPIVSTSCGKENQRVGTLQKRNDDDKGLEKAPEEIFPIEVWCIIFDKLKSPRDLLNCAKSSLVFRKALQPKRIHYLFPHVLPILVKNGVFLTHPYPNHGLFYRLLELRLVCSSWRSGVDTFMDTHPCHYHLDDVCTKPITRYRRCRRTDPEYCFKTFNISSPIPLFIHGRTISLFDSPASSTADNIWFWRRVRNWLRTVGPHIWYLKIPRMQVQDNLWKVLKLVPNLKVLNVTVSNSFTRDERVPRFPPLPKLQVLKVRSEEARSEVVCRLLNTYTHVKKLGLEMMDGKWAQEKYTGFSDLLQDIHRPNLEALCAPKIRTVEDESRLRRLIGNCPNLQSFSFRLPEAGSCQRIFKTLQTKGGVSLTTLHLTFPIHCNNGNALVEDLRLLPCLQNLIVYTGNGGLLSLDFILPLKTLCKLTIIGGKWDECEGTDKPEPKVKEVGNVINFLGLERRLYKSNIWELLPQLEEVLLKGSYKVVQCSCFYDRSGYDMHKKAKIWQNKAL